MTTTITIDTHQSTSSRSGSRSNSFTDEGSSGTGVHVSPAGSSEIRAIQPLDLRHPTQAIETDRAGVDLRQPHERQLVTDIPPLNEQIDVHQPRACIGILCRHHPQAWIPRTTRAMAEAFLHHSMGPMVVGCLKATPPVRTRSLGLTRPPPLLQGQAR
jgi:hypothetical protein